MSAVAGCYFLEHSSRFLEALGGDQVSWRFRENKQVEEKSQNSEDEIGVEEVFVSRDISEVEGQPDVEGARHHVVDSGVDGPLLYPHHLEEHYVSSLGGAGELETKQQGEEIGHPLARAQNKQQQQHEVAGETNEDHLALAYTVGERQPED